MLEEKIIWIRTLKKEKTEVIKEKINIQEVMIEIIKMKESKKITKLIGEIKMKETIKRTEVTGKIDVT